MTQTPRTASRRRSRLARGMTLIEIMVVVTILGLIAGAVGIGVIGALNDAKNDTAKQEIGTIQNGLKLFYTRKGKYPDTGTGLKALVDSQIIDKTVDPWGNEYVYLLQGNKPQVTSYGPDGAPNTEDDISGANAATAQK
jgi:general secretion pathway protein G